MIHIVIILIVIGILLWLEETYIPMATPIKLVIRVVVLVCVVFWLLGLFGLFPMNDVPVPHIH